MIKEILILSMTAALLLMSTGCRFIPTMPEIFSQVDPDAPPFVPFDNCPKTVDKPNGG